MTVHNKLVSVVIPTYKRSVDFLSRAVESVRNQTYPWLDIVVIDDSRDDFSGRADVAAYMRNLEQTDSRVRYFQNETNLGGSLARNRGIDLAKGEYITFLDDDDEYMPEKIEKQIEFMSYSDYDLTFSNMIMYSTDGRVVDYREYADIPAFDNDSLLKYHLTRHLTGTPTFMFRAERLREIGGFEDAKMGQEFYLMLKSIRQGLKIGYFPECYVKVYKHDGEAISSGMNKINGENALYEYKKQFFDILSAQEIRRVRFRHYAVMVVAYKRNRMYGRMLWAGITAFVSAPTVFFKEVGGFLRKVFAHRK